MARSSQEGFQQRSCGLYAPHALIHNQLKMSYPELLVADLALVQDATVTPHPTALASDFLPLAVSLIHVQSLSFSPYHTQKPQDPLTSGPDLPSL